MEVPPEAQALVPYLRRVDELEKPAPQVAFYVLKYVLERLRDLRQTTDVNQPAFDNYLLTQLTRAEALQPGVNKETGPNDYRRFCHEKADKAHEDEQVSVDAKLFQYYVAGLFFDTLQQFGELSSAEEEKRTYAKAQATQLKRRLDGNVSQQSLKKGRESDPSSRDDAETQDAASSSLSPHIASTSTTPIIAAPPSTTVRPSDSQHTPIGQALPTTTQSPPLLAAPAPAVAGSHGDVPNKNIRAALKKAQHAVSALAFNDVNDARVHLRDALELLTTADVVSQSTP